MTFKRVSHRVFFYFSILTTFLSMFFVGLAAIIGYVVEDEVINNLLRKEAAHITDVYHKTGKIVQPGLRDFVVYPHPQALPDELQSPVSINTKDSEMTTGDGRYFHFRYIEVGREQPLVLIAEVSDLLTVSQIKTDIAIIVLIIFVIASGISIWLTYKVASKTTSPLVQLVADIKAAEQNPVDATFSAVQLQDEIGYFARTIQQALSRQYAALQREQDFTRDVSHELRTPVTLLKNLVELQQIRPLTEDDNQLMADNIGQLEAIIHVLLALVRESSIEKQSFKLDAVIEESVLASWSIFETRAIEVDVKSESGLYITASPTLTRLLLDNLIQNAVKHGDAGKITIDATSHHIRILNSGTSSTVTEAADKLTKRGARREQSDGIGQGLYLVKRIVEASGWSLQINQTENEFIVTIVF